MPISCSAIDCSNRFVKGSEIRFYRFPISKPQLAEQWVRSLGRKNFVPTQNSCLCSEHFQPDCFRDYNGKLFLREDAVPTIFTNSGGDGTKIELRRNRGGIVGKEVNESNAAFKQMTKDRRQPIRDSSLKGRGPNERRRAGGKLSSGDRQSLSVKNKVYDSKGLLISCGKDLCDCLDIDCMGCFYPCPECGSRKCGVECRCDRKWLYEQVEVEGGEIIRNKFAN
ncbi:ARL14 effector protein [Triplophysa rosa]|uniref:ARL14 effector protein n=1 Tax=Triplophysa rosa TaxID=992332 RepID=A0A9W8CC58_TRIRA|nr:ARL14 effector protein [Triplophysa rosa]KAI7814049.1 ARL14 effector protein [Triplophysa rosa]